MPLEHAVNHRKKTLQEAEETQAADLATAFWTSRQTVSMEELFRLKALYLALKDAGVLANTEHAEFFRSLEYRTRWYGVGSHSSSFYRNGATYSSTKTIAIQNPTHILASCDGYLFSFSDFPIEAPTHQLPRSLKLGSFDASMMFHEFGELSTLERPALDAVKNRFPNLQLIVGVNEESVQQIGTLAQNESAQRLKRRIQRTAITVCLIPLCLTSADLAATLASVQASMTLHFVAICFKIGAALFLVLALFMFRKIKNVTSILQKVDTIAFSDSSFMPPIEAK